MQKKCEKSAKLIALHLEKFGKKYLRENYGHFVETLLARLIQNCGICRPRQKSLKGV